MTDLTKTLNGPVFYVGNKPFTLLEILRQRRSKQALVRTTHKRDYSENNRCFDCGRPITNAAKRCSKCF